MRHSIFLLIAATAMILVGCSGGGTPVSPDLSKYGTQPDAKSASGTGHFVWGVYDLGFDLPTQTFRCSPNRQAYMHVGVNELSGQVPAGDYVTIDFTGIDRDNRVLRFDITLQNPFAKLQARDVRAVISGDHPGYYLVNSDGGLNIFGTDVSPKIDTFIAYAKDQPDRVFGAGMSYTGSFELHYPAGADFSTLRLAIDATHPGNCPEPYGFSEFSYDDNRMIIGVLDWQDDIESVEVLTSLIGGNSNIRLEYEDYSSTWQVYLRDDTAGFYRILDAEFIGNLLSDGPPQPENGLSLGSDGASGDGNIITRKCLIKAESNGQALYGLLRLKVEQLPEDLIAQVKSVLKMSKSLQEEYADPTLQDEYIKIVAYVAGTPPDIYAGIKNDADWAYPELKSIAEEIKNVYRSAQPEISRFAEQYYEAFAASDEDAMALYRSILRKHGADRSRLGPMIKQLEVLREQRADYVARRLESEIEPLQQDAIRDVSLIDDSEILGTDYVINVIFIETKVKHLGTIASLDSIHFLQYDNPPELAMDHAHVAVNAPDMWGAGYTGGTFDVCVIDTGVDETHPALIGHFAPGQAMAFGGCGNPDDDDYGVYAGHGTHCAGIVASTDALYTGVGTGLDKLYNGKICPSTGWSSFTQARDWAGLGGTVADPCETLSLSWAIGPGAGCVRDGAYYTSRYMDETTYLYGQLWSIAAGNSGGSICGDDNNITMPSDAFNTFGVANMDDKNTDSRADDSITGSSRLGFATTPGGEVRIRPDIAAPGRSIMSANTYWETEADFVAKTGTSMAAPNVAGATALIMDAGITSSLEVRAFLDNTAEDWNSNMNGPGSDGPDIYTGYGYMNLNTALLNLGNIVSDTIATSDVRYYRHSGHGTADSVMLMWDRYVSGLTLTEHPDIDLEVWDDTTNMLVNSEDKTYDNKRFLYTGTTNDLVYKIEAMSIPAVSPTWDYVITAKGGTLSTELFPGDIDPVLNAVDPMPVGIPVIFEATITNNGDFVLRDVQATLNLDTNMSFQGGSIATQTGAAMLAPTQNCIIQWNIQLDVYSATPKHLTVDTAATAYGEVFTGFNEVYVDAIIPDPILNVAPTTLDFGDTQTDLTFDITNVGYNTLTWTIDDTVFPAWLSVDITGDTTSSETDTVTVSVDRSGLATGFYSYDIDVNSDYGDDIVHIDMEVPDPVLYVDPVSLDFGGAILNIPFNIENSGGGMLTWSINDGLFPAWLSIDVNGDTTWGETDVVIVTVDRSGQPIGPYAFDIDVISDGGNDVVHIDMVVPDPTAPLLDVFPNNLDFTDPLTMLPFEVQNPGGNILNWAIDDSAFPVWLSVDNLGDSCTTEIDTVNVTVDRTGLTLTAYSHDIEVTSNGGSEFVHVDLEVLDPVIMILNINEENLYFGTTFTQKNVTITNAGVGTLEWELQHEGIYEFPEWLSASLYNGIVDEIHPQGGTIVYVDRSGMAPSTYTHDLYFTSNGGDGIVHVFMTVPAPDPEISVNFDVLNFGDDEIALNFIVSNIGIPGSTLDWTMPLFGKPAWVNASKYSGSIGTTQVSNVQVVVDRDGLDPDDYQHIFNITSNGGPESVEVNMTVAGIDPLAPLLIAPIDQYHYEVCAWLAFAWDGDPGYDGNFWIDVKRNGQVVVPFSNLPIPGHSLSLPPALVDKLCKYGTWEWQISMLESAVPPVKHSSDWWTLYKDRPELLTPFDGTIVDAATVFTWDKVPTTNATRTIYVAKITGFAPIDPLYAWWPDADTAILPSNWYDILGDIGNSNTYTWTVAAVKQPTEGMTVEYAEAVKYPPPFTFHLN